MVVDGASATPAVRRRSRGSIPAGGSACAAVAELKVEGPAAAVSYEEPYAASPGTWTISSLMPSGS